MAEYRFGYERNRGRIKILFGFTARNDQHAKQKMHRLVTMMNVKYIADSLQVLRDHRWQFISKPKVLERLDSAADKAITAEVQTFRLKATR